jgi:hypothetical protein
VGVSAIQLGFVFVGATIPQPFEPDWTNWKGFLMDNHVTQFATIFDAFGCELRYNSQDATIEVIEAPKGSKAIVDKALDEIQYYDDTKNYVDGMAALCVADYIDDLPNPVSTESRLNILHALGIMKDSKYIHQTLVLQKNNRSWHFSNIANDCKYFGEECTHRGINPDPDRKGRRSSRKPEDYHKLNNKGEIVREQLVTSGLESVFKDIPKDSLISGKIGVNIDLRDLRSFKKLPIDEQLKIINDLQESIA